jgi:uncharacterized protein (DUF2141 family)
MRSSFALALLAGIAVAAPSYADVTGVLSVRVVSLRNDHGQVGCLLFASDRGYPKDPNAAIQRRWCSIQGAESVCRFDPIAAGTYALACFHDENKNGKLDTNFLGIPNEGTVASNQAKGFMGPPHFNDAKFSFSGAATELRLRISY